MQSTCGLHLANRYEQGALESDRTEFDYGSFSPARKTGANHESLCISFSHPQNGNNSVYIAGRIKHDHECEGQSCTKRFLKKIARVVGNPKAEEGETEQITFNQPKEGLHAK